MTSGSRISLFFDASDAIESASAKEWFMRLGAVMASFTPLKPAGCASRQRPVAHGRIATGWVRGRRSLDSAASRRGIRGRLRRIIAAWRDERAAWRDARPTGHRRLDAPAPAANQGPGVELIDPSAA
jgi:hypothetical protein